MLEPAPGVEFGRYVMVGRAEHYGAGSLVAAREARSGARRSLWLVMPHAVDDATARGPVIDAATRLRRLESPHLVQLHEFGEIDGQPFFATAPLDGVDLVQACTPDGLPPWEALELVAQIGTGINHLHHVGLVDGALGPHRVLVEQRGDRFHASVVHAALLPLLLVNSALFDDQLREVLDFAAPELHEDADPTVRSDVYSLGCLLWLALTGRPPFASYVGHVTSPVPQVSGDGPVEEALNSVLQRALAKDPEARYRDAAAFVATLRSIAALARDADVAQPPPRVVPRRAAEAPADHGELASEPPAPPAAPRHAAAPPAGPAAVVEPERALDEAMRHWATRTSTRRTHHGSGTRRSAQRMGVAAVVLGGLAATAVWGVRHAGLLDGGDVRPSVSALPDAASSATAPADPLALLVPIAGKHGCRRDTAQVAHRIEQWSCERHGYRVLLTHWDSEASARALVPHDGERGAREPWILDGTRSGTQWTWRATAGPRTFRWTGVYSSVPYAVVIEAKDAARRRYAREHVVIHPSTVLG
jgi:hypothetical protein